MSHCALLRRIVAPRSRSWARLAALLLALLPGRAALAQSDLFQDEIDLAGRTTLTLGAGARAYGMGGSFLARADDATAASWNPAGLSYLRVPELSLVGNYNVFHSTIGIGAGSAESDELRGGTLVDFASFTWPIRIGGSLGSVQVNYQRGVPFDGSRTIRTDDPFGERSAIGESDGGYDVLAFGTGLKVTRKLRVGATFNRWFNGYTASLERLVPSGLRPRRVLAQEFHLTGWNSNLGFMYSPVDQVNVAAVFKTAFTGKVELAKMRTDYYADSTGELTGTTRNAFSSDDVRIDFPWSLGFGVSWRPRSQLTLSADYTKTNWSESTIRNYFTLTATPLSTPDQPPPPTFYTSLPYPYVYLQQSQNDSEEIRAGVEYVVIRESLKVPLRAGYFNDKQINIFGVESAPRFNGFTVGTGVILGPVVFDIAYLFEFGELFRSNEVVPGDDETNNVVQESVRSTIHNQRLFVSLIYRFGRP
jgi:long-subunit fatty acid transport protein